jgi:transcriptional regulator GlxA family with amidase domain
MLTVHLLRSHGSSERPPIPHRGGLAPRQMRRVLDYIDAHLTDELGLVELAAIAELSPPSLRGGVQNFSRKITAPISHGKARSACAGTPAR